MVSSISVPCGTAVRVPPSGSYPSPIPLPESLDPALALGYYLSYVAVAGQLLALAEQDEITELVQEVKMFEPEGQQPAGSVRFDERFPRRPQGQS